MKSYIAKRFQNDGGTGLTLSEAEAKGMNLDAARANTLARRILTAHNKGAAAVPMDFQSFVLTHDYTGFLVQKLQKSSVFR